MPEHNKLKTQKLNGRADLGPVKPALIYLDRSLNIIGYIARPNSDYTHSFHCSVVSFSHKFKKQSCRLLSRLLIKYAVAKLRNVLSNVQFFITVALIQDLLAFNRGVVFEY
uniref:Uncharacterized protein n=1 Tax=Pararge aegeria TaxID=116150 RepID=S4NVU4_9NEOP